MNNMKFAILLVVLILINTLYWGWSEVYIHQGIWSLGLLKGLIISLTLALIGFVVGYFGTRIN